MTYGDDVKTLKKTKKYRFNNFNCFGLPIIKGKTF